MREEINIRTVEYTVCGQDTFFCEQNASFSRTTQSGFGQTVRSFLTNLIMKFNLALIFNVVKSK